MKTESVTISPPKKTCLENKSRIKNYVKLPRLKTRKFSGDYIHWKSFMVFFE